jgi:lysophospholipid acyltransferase (LPLAT)-like uncharacterized protein
VFRKYVLSLIVFIVYRTLSWTWRVRLIEPDSLKTALKTKKAVVLAHWHGDELALISLAHRYRLATITSTSKDGELMNSVLTMMGVKTSRGSSTRGAVTALKGLLRLAKAGRNCSFAVDGPKGPLHKVKPGVFELSRSIHGPIYAVGVSCDRAIHFPRSWNKTYLPKPFAQIVVYWVEAHNPITKEDDPRNPDLALELEAQLHGARQQALKFIADNDA